MEICPRASHNTTSAVRSSYARMQKKTPRSKYDDYPEQWKYVRNTQE